MTSNLVISIKEGKVKGIIKKILMEVNLSVFKEYLTQNHPLETLGLKYVD